MSFSEKLIQLLKTDSRFVDDEGELVLAAVQDRAWKMDRDLVKLLLADEEIKTKFFDEIEGHWIFNVNTFLDYISQKNFLDNSYTRFRNRIGLTIGGKYLRERGEVALVWPYKDCVLEGGQTKEEEKRKELFFNEVLAQDEINRLLDPKVLTNFKRYVARPAGADGESADAKSRAAATKPAHAAGTSEQSPRQLSLGTPDEDETLPFIGETASPSARSDIELVAENVTDFKRDENGVIRENLIIKGNNLLALHTLKTQFRGQVKLIYIDPPYNTGNDSFGYNDNFNHSTWLTFMRNRLEAAKELLRQDGSIWINIDDNESHYLKVLCDDVFGRENFVTTVTWEKKVSPSNDATWFSGDHDYILIYAKSKINWKINRLPMTLKQKGFYKNPDNDPRGEWNSATYTCNKSKYERPNLYYPIINPNTGEIIYPSDTAVWAYSKEVYEEHKRANLIYWGKDGKSRTPRLKKFLSLAGNVVPRTIWNYGDVGHTQEAKHEAITLADGQVFTTPKPERLLQRIIYIATNIGDLVLDFQLGSGTTSAVAHKMSRQYIGIEQMDYIKTIPVERLKKVIAGEQGGISKSINWQGGGDFIYCELMKYNEAFMERIQAAQSSAELLQIWRAMAEGSFLNWYVNPRMPEEAIRDFEALGKEEKGLEKQKKLLAELLDKNQLYVNLSEIDDAMFHVSAEDKELNRKFYGEI